MYFSLLATASFFTIFVLVLVIKVLENDIGVEAYTFWWHTHFRKLNAIKASMQTTTDVFISYSTI